MVTKYKSVHERKTTYEAARAIHELCKQLQAATLTKEQRLMLNNIDAEAFRIFTNPNVQL